MIDYNIIQRSIDYYESKGFARIEAPWTITEAVDNITRPKDKQNFQLKHNNKCLVASGEQSFLYLYLKNFIPKGQFQTVTPCFRYEAFDFLHTKYFIKNELIKTNIVNVYELEKVITISLGFYKQFFPKAEVISKSDGSFDIEIKGHELGSYGIRSCEFLDWIYATGCAEPRTSNLIKLYGISQSASILKGTLGEFSKIQEEYEELEDAILQGCKPLVICELSDLYGAIEEYVKKYNLTMTDIKQFSDLTKSAFKEGKRM